MPTNKDFMMSILVGGVELPEYHRDGICYVESNLFTPVSYTTETAELVQGEVEKQSWPVTPYQVKVTSKSNTPYSYYKVFVDGQKASQVAVHPGKSCVSEGFYDGIQITEFLFSLPRLPQNKKDRVDQSKASKVGLIEVECWNSKVTGYKKPMISQIVYNQANKKDSSAVTDGKYIMSTTKMGRAVRETKKSTVEDWTLFNVRSQLSVKYVMGHALVDMGFKIRPIRIPIHRIPASVLSQPLFPQFTQFKRKRPGPKSKTMPQLMAVLPPVPEVVLPSVIEIDTDSDTDVIDVDAKKQKLSDESVELDLDAFIAEVTGESSRIEPRNEGAGKNDKDGDSGESVGKPEESGEGTSKGTEEKNTKNDEDVDAVKIEIDVDDDVSEAGKESNENQEKDVPDKEKTEANEERNESQEDSDLKEDNDKEGSEAREDEASDAVPEPGDPDPETKKDDEAEKEVQVESDVTATRGEPSTGDDAANTEDADLEKNDNGVGEKDETIAAEEGSAENPQEKGKDDNVAVEENAGKEGAERDNTGVDEEGGGGEEGESDGGEEGGSGDGEGGSGGGEGGSGGGDGESGGGGVGVGEGAGDGEESESGDSEQGNTNIEKLWEIMGNNTPEGETSADTCTNLMEEIAKFAPLGL